MFSKLPNDNRGKLTCKVLAPLIDLTIYCFTKKIRFLSRKQVKEGNLITTRLTTSYVSFWDEKDGKYHFYRALTCRRKITSPFPTS